MNWIKLILGLISTGLEVLRNHQLLQAGRKEKELEDEKDLAQILEARDSVTDSNADQFMHRPEER